jgi:hypothetical protein
VPALGEVEACRDALAAWLMVMEGFDEMEGVGTLDVEMD